MHVSPWRRCMLCYRRGGGARVSLVIYGSSKLTRSLYHPRALHPAAFVRWLAAAALSACCAPVRCVAALAARVFGAKSAEIADPAPAPEQQVGARASSSKGANDGGGDDDTGSQPPPVVTAQSHESPLPRRDAPAGAPATAPAVVPAGIDADGNAPLMPARRSSQPGDTAEEVRSPSHPHKPHASESRLGIHDRMHNYGSESTMPSNRSSSSTSVRQGPGGRRRRGRCPSRAAGGSCTACRASAASWKSRSRPTRLHPAPASQPDPVHVSPVRIAGARECLG